MINKYNEFISESKIVELINEGALEASDEFLIKLKKLSNQNQIASIIYKSFKNSLFILKDLTNNFIDVTSEDDMITFLTDRKYKMLKDDESPFTSTGRTKIKIGRFVKAFFNNTDIINKLKSYNIIDDSFSINEKDIENFVNLYKSIKVDTKNKFYIIKGRDIAKWYNSSNYSKPIRGTLGSSCMANVDQTYFDIYVKNNKVCHLLIYVNADNELLGRALLWKLSESPSPLSKYFMDRVYTSFDSDLHKFIEYAISNKWLYKHKMSSTWDESMLFYYNRTPVFGKASVKLSISEFLNYPFLDTLSFLDKKNKILSNVGFENGYLLCDTSGGIDTCDECNGSGKINTEVCKYCDENNMCICDNCLGSGCSNCNNKGEVECFYCSDSNTKECPECTGIENTLKNIIKKTNQFPEYKQIIK